MNTNKLLNGDRENGLDYLGVVFQKPAGGDLRTELDAAQQAFSLCLLKPCACAGSEL